MYAYDYSEYETPLVGQGMLSWILASASTTPNAPAEESQTMVTGRVCKNILGLFSNGIKETLEVKLKLVPVPTCMQSEYVENMERYHSLSKIMPENMDYKEWAEFLKANPAIGQLAQPTTTNAPPTTESMASTTIESFNEMMMNNSSFSHHRMSFGNYDTRASSPALSTTSAYPYQMNPDYRPASQASFRSEPAAFSPYYPNHDELVEQPEEGPPKKRAKVTKATRPRKTTLGPNADSLRVTASTAASVRLHRPTPVNVGAAVSAEQVPRAPTPRPHRAGLLTNCPRVAAPSRLRNASMDSGRPTMSSYDSGIFSDNAMESADDDKGDSPSETTPNMPSSPPLPAEHTASPVPSSPELPTLPPPNDSGFASDLPLGHNDEASRRAMKRHRPSQQRRETELKSIDADLLNHFLKQYGTAESQGGASQSIEAVVANGEMATAVRPPMSKSTQSCQTESSPPTHATSNPASRPGASRAETPKPSRPVSKTNRTLVRSQTWAGEPMSDAAGPDDVNEKQPRSGANAKRGKQTKYLIKERLENAITSGQLPTFCANCGQIETPAWRKAYTRIEMGTTENIEVTSKGTGIVAFEALNPAEHCGVPHYRIFKTDLAPEEREMQASAQPDKGDEGLYTVLTLCNSCGLWLSKKNAMRPQDVWGRRAPPQSKSRSQNPGEKPKRIRKPKKPRTDNDPFTSDAIVPESDTGLFDAPVDGEMMPPAEGMADSQMLPPVRTRSKSVQVSGGSKLDDATARAALERAFQSSPVGVRGRSKETAIDIDNDLTPKPTRRLLFPSPRKPGEVKSLSDSTASQPLSPRSAPPRPARIPVQSLDAIMEGGDKENCPPPMENGDDDLAHLFESPKVTPTKVSSFEDLLKTPTPGSRQRVALIPVGHADINLATPSRSSRTPKGSGRTALLAPETPFTRQLNDILSDSIVNGSPSQHFDFSAFPTFNTPGHSTGLQFGDFLHHDTLSSDLPVPSSSPPRNYDFSVFEDPNSNTVGLWSGPSIFDMNDAIMSDAPLREQQVSDLEDRATPKILTVNGISLDFSAMIEDVVGHTERRDSEMTSAATTSAVTVEVQQESPVVQGQQRTSNTPAASFNSVPEVGAGEARRATSDEDKATSMSTALAPAKPLHSRPDLVPTCEKPAAPLRSGKDPESIPKPRCLRCKEKKKGCDRQRPCGRCVRSKVGIEGCIIEEEAATSPAFSASAEPQFYTSPFPQDYPPPAQTASIPIDPALSGLMATGSVPKASDVSFGNTTAHAPSPSVSITSFSAVKQEAVTPNAMDVTAERVSTPGQAIMPSAPTSEATQLS